MTRVIARQPQPVRFVVRLTPKGGRDAIEGWQSDAAGRRVLKARVAAPAEDGKANAALVKLVAGALDVARSKVRIVAGASARVKTVEVEGGSNRLDALLRDAGRRA